MNTEGLILVTGGTGGLDRRVVSRLREAGRAVRVLSRRAHDPRPGVEYVIGELAKDAGVEVALRGAEMVVHCAGSPRMREDVAHVGSLVPGAGHRSGDHWFATNFTDRRSCLCLPSHFASLNLSGSSRSSERVVLWLHFELGG